MAGNVGDALSDQIAQRKKPQGFMSGAFGFLSSKPGTPDIGESFTSMATPFLAKPGRDSFGSVLPGYGQKSAFAAYGDRSRTAGPAGVFGQNKTQSASSDRVGPPVGSGGPGDKLGPPVIGGGSPVFSPDMSAGMHGRPGAPTTPFGAAQQQRMGQTSGAPMNGDTPAVLGATHPGMSGGKTAWGMATPGGMGQDPIEGMLMQRLKASQNPGNYTGGSPQMAFNVAGPVDPSGMGGTGLGRMLGFNPTFVPHQGTPGPVGGIGDAMSNDFGQSLSGMLHLRGGQQHLAGNMAHAQAQQTGAEAELMKAHAMTRPGFMEAQAGMQPGEMAERELFSGSPGAWPIHQDPNATFEQMKPYLSGPHTNRAMSEAMLRRKESINPNFRSQATSPGGLEWLLDMALGRTPNPVYAQNSGLLQGFPQQQR